MQHDVFYLVGGMVAFIVYPLQGGVYQFPHPLVYSFFATGDEVLSIKGIEDVRRAVNRRNIVYHTEEKYPDGRDMKGEYVFLTDGQMGVNVQVVFAHEIRSHWSPF